MIRKADEKDLNTLYTLYSNTYPRDYVEYFFDYEYKPFDMYLTEDAEGMTEIDRLVLKYMGLSDE